MIKINGVTVKTPKSFTVLLADIDSENTTRNAKGEMIRHRLGVKRKLELEWPPLTNGEISTILGAVKDTFFTVEYPDPRAGGMRTGTFYVGDRTAPMYRFNRTIWEGLSMNFIER